MSSIRFESYFQIFKGKQLHCWVSIAATFCKGQRAQVRSCRFDDSALYNTSPNEDEEIEDMANFTRDKMKELIESLF